MEGDAFVAAVRERANVESTDAARDLVEATLVTLGERVSTGEAEDVAASLPPDLRWTFTERSRDEPPEESLDAFVDRVAERAGGLDDADAMRGIRAVTRTLAEAVGNAELRAARQQLPNEYDSIFEPVDGPG